MPLLPYFCCWYSIIFIFLLLLLVLPLIIDALNSAAFLTSLLQSLLMLLLLLELLLPHFVDTVSAVPAVIAVDDFAAVALSMSVLLLLPSLPSLS